MIVKKCTTGVVVQHYDTEEDRFLSQSFHPVKTSYEHMKGTEADPALVKREQQFTMMPPIGVECFFPVEYLDGVGIDAVRSVYLPFALLDCFEGSEADRVKTAFMAVVHLPHDCILKFNLDERYDAEGNLLD